MLDYPRELAAGLKTELSAFEKGRSLPSARTLESIAKATGHKLIISFTRLPELPVRSTRALFFAKRSCYGCTTQKVTFASAVALFIGTSNDQHTACAH